MNYAHRAERRNRTARTTSTNVSLDASLVAEARELGVNISKASVAGLRAAVRKAREEQWLRENGPALNSWNAYVEAQGLPLSHLRRF